MSGTPLKDRVALVTGASRGIGRAIARRLAENGADVALVARNQGLLQEARTEIEALGQRAMVVPLDVADGEAVTQAVSNVAKEMGGLDILVNNAGLTRDGLLMRMSDEDWDQVLDVDLKGVFYLCRAAARVLRKSPAGRIVNISSIVGLVGNAGQVNYAAAKAGLFGLTRSLAKELGGRGITVNAVCPGFIETDMTSGLPEAIRDSARAAIPLGRFGAAAEIAGLVALLCSDSGAYITGTVIPVDGGLSLGKIG